MKYIEQAIKEAVEKGRYVAPHEYNCQYCDDAFGRPPLCVEKALLDPLFWQALGKAREWDDFMTEFIPHLEYANGTIFGWKAVWHNFIDHLAEGKDAESFFAALINQDGVEL